MKNENKKKEKYFIGYAGEKNVDGRKCFMCVCRNKIFFYIETNLNCIENFFIFNIKVALVDL